MTQNTCRTASPSFISSKFMSFSAKGRRVAREDPGRWNRRRRRAATEKQGGGMKVKKGKRLKKKE